MPGTEEPQDVCGPEDSKGNLESPKQGSSKMKLKSRLSGKQDSTWAGLSENELPASLVGR